jgi:hypothetical protein
MDRLCDVDHVVLCICNSGGELSEEVLDMSRDYGAVGADVRGCEGGADDFTAAVTVFGVGTSGEDVGGAGSWVTGEGVEVAFSEAMIEAVDGFKGLWGGEGEPVRAGADNGAVFLVQVLLDDVQIASQIVIELPVGSVRLISKVVGGGRASSSTYQTLLMLAKNGPG